MHFKSDVIMRILLLIVINVIFLTQLKAQFVYTLFSYPDSAAVYKNGKLVCTTPCKVKYYWREAQNNKLVFKVEKEGFESWADTLHKKPNEFDKYNSIDLKYAYEVYDFENAPILTFDKLVINIKNGTVIGKKSYLDGRIENTKWEGSIKVGDEYFGNKFIETSTNMGYRTIISESSELFSDKIKKETRLPRYSIGVEVKDYKVNHIEEKVKVKSFPKIKVRTEMAFLWSVYDNKVGSVVFTYENAKSINNRERRYQDYEYHSIVYELAMIDFLQNQDFVELIEKGDNYVAEGYTISTAAKREPLTLTNPELPQFGKLSEMIKHANQACVTVITDGGHGSGVLISSEGLLLSSYHVVEGVNKIDIKFSSGLTLPAEVLDFDKKRDVVLLKVHGSGYIALPLEEDNAFSLGEDVITIGSPADIKLGQSVSRGIMSGEREINDNIFWQVDMSVSPGNSGGPLLNEKGQIIGLISSKIVGAGIEGIGFAIPISTVNEVFNLNIK